jgi:hypothetical protein
MNFLHPSNVNAIHHRRRDWRRGPMRPTALPKRVGWLAAGQPGPE